MKKGTLVNEKRIFAFVDLDDTLFQTKQKNEQGVTPATQAANVNSVSYMTDYQSLFLELLQGHNKVSLIPTTARDLRQYHNTLISQQDDIQYAILYFGAVILNQGSKDQFWDTHIQTKYKKLSCSIEDIYAQMNEKKHRFEHGERFKLANVDGYYVAIKAERGCDPKIVTDLFEQLKALCPNDYFVHINGRALSLIPRCSDKSRAVEYLINQYQPTLTLGVGDSLTDLPFMQCCDYRIFPRAAQIEEKIGGDENSYL